MYSINTKTHEKLLKYFKCAGILMIAMIMHMHSSAQVTDSAKAKAQKEYKNTIKVNLTSWVIYKGGFQLNYERVLSKKSSITVWGGPIQFPMPSIISNSSIKLDADKQKSGYTFGADYRFYLAKENKYAAPHGLYLAPFISFYNFNNVRTGRDTSNEDNLSLNTTMQFLNIGGELGYQFVIIKNRVVIDCVLLGPAVSSYNFSLQLKGSTSGDYNEQVQAILDALKEKYPLLKDLSNGLKVSSSGVSNFWSLGWRYAIHIGFRF